MLLNRSQCVFYKGPGSHGFVFEDCLHLAAEAASQILNRQDHFVLCNRAILCRALYAARGFGKTSEWLTYVGHLAMVQLIM